jgi:hypothetical protein
VRRGGRSREGKRGEAPPAAAAAAAAAAKEARGKTKEMTVEAQMRWYIVA